MDFSGKDLLNMHKHIKIFASSIKNSILNVNCESLDISRHIPLNRNARSQCFQGHVMGLALSTLGLSYL